MNKAEIEAKIESLQKKLENKNLADYHSDFRQAIKVLEGKLENLGKATVEAVKPVTPRKPKTEKTQRTAKTEKTQRTPKTKVQKPVTQTKSDLEQAKAEIKRATGKTEEECEAIIEQYKALRAKSQERKKKEDRATEKNKDRVEKLKKDDKLIPTTTEKNAPAVIETAVEEIPEKINKEMEVIEEVAKEEATKEVEKEKPNLKPAEKKEAIKEKTEEKAKVKVEKVIERVTVDTSALLKVIAESLGKFDKDSQKEFLIKLRSDIDKLLSSFSFGGITSGATQGYNITQSNLSSSSVNMFGGGGRVGKNLHEKVKKLLGDISVNNHKHNPLRQSYIDDIYDNFDKNKDYETVLRIFYNYEMYDKGRTIKRESIQDISKQLELALKEHNEYGVKYNNGGGVEDLDKYGTLHRGNEFIKYQLKDNGNYKVDFYRLEKIKGGLHPVPCEKFRDCPFIDFRNVHHKELKKYISENNFFGGGGKIEYNEFGVPKGYLYLSEFANFDSKASGELTDVSETILEDNFLEDQSEEGQQIHAYLHDLPHFMVYNNRIPRNNPESPADDQPITDNYLIFSPIEDEDEAEENGGVPYYTFFVDTQGYDYPRYITRLVNYFPSDDQTKDLGYMARGARVKSAKNLNFTQYRDDKYKAIGTTNEVYYIEKGSGADYFLMVDGRTKCKGTFKVCEAFANDIENKKFTGGGGVDEKAEKLTQEEYRKYLPILGIGGVGLEFNFNGKTVGGYIVPKEGDDLEDLIAQIERATNRKLTAVPYNQERNIQVSGTKAGWTRGKNEIWLQIIKKMETGGGGVGRKKFPISFLDRNSDRLTIDKIDGEDGEGSYLVIEDSEGEYIDEYSIPEGQTAETIADKIMQDYGADSGYMARGSRVKSGKELSISSEYLLETINYIVEDYDGDVDSYLNENGEDSLDKSEQKEIKQFLKDSEGLVYFTGEFFDWKQEDELFEYVAEQSDEYPYSYNAYAGGDGTAVVLSKVPIKNAEPIEDYSEQMARGGMAKFTGGGGVGNSSFNPYGLLSSDPNAYSKLRNKIKSHPRVTNFSVGNMDGVFYIDGKSNNVPAEDFMVMATPYWDGENSMPIEITLEDDFEPEMLSIVNLPNKNWQLDEFIDWYYSKLDMIFGLADSYMESRQMARGGMTEHGLKINDRIAFDLNTINKKENRIVVSDEKGKSHYVDLDKGKRYSHGGNIHKNHKI